MAFILTLVKQKMTARHYNSIIYYAYIYINIPVTHATAI